MEFKSVQSSDLPISLLLEADPSETSIQGYLANALCFAAIEEEQIRGICVVNHMSDIHASANTPLTYEVYNLAVEPSYQAKGIGSQLLRFVLDQLYRQGVGRVELGTGTFGYQLAFYQRIGFRVDSVLIGYFLDNYPEPIFENGIQHKDMLRLYVELE